MNRRRSFTLLPALLSARTLLAGSGRGKSRVGLAAFSSHQHWRAAGEGSPGVKFTEALGFYDYVRSLGGDGVQCSLRGKDVAFAKALRARVEGTGGYYEADVSLPRMESDLAGFEADVRLAQDAGATLARTVFTGSRRYEGFKSLVDFREFQKQSEHRLAMVEPILKRNRFKLAVENHKDNTAPELEAIMRRISSEWIGVTVDTGNNIALLEEPHAVVELLAPFAFTVHLKDMAVQSYDKGLLLSEVCLGTGFLDLRRMISTLRKANPSIIFNIEMATRDPLKVPFQTDGYWAPFEMRDEASIAAARSCVKSNPLKEQPPLVTGKALATILNEEETNNRRCLLARRALQI